jgi:hypothetical protein
MSQIALEPLYAEEPQTAEDPPAVVMLFPHRAFCSFRRSFTPQGCLAP